MIDLCDNCNDSSTKLIKSSKIEVVTKNHDYVNISNTAEALIIP